MTDRQAFIEVLKELRLKTCVYSLGKQASMCDCKFHQIGRPLNVPKGSETSNGCPELLWCIGLIQSLTDKQWMHFCASGQLQRTGKKKPLAPATDASDKER